jgi:hypothetical protein
MLLNKEAIFFLSSRFCRTAVLPRLRAFEQYLELLLPCDWLSFEVRHYHSYQVRRLWND